MSARATDVVVLLLAVPAVPGATPLKQLLNDAMILARSRGYDVFNALDLLDVRVPAADAWQRPAPAVLLARPARDASPCVRLCACACFACRPQNSSELLRDLKFGIGDGQLHYYLYNWRLREGLRPNDVGLILM